VEYKNYLQKEWRTDLLNGDLGLDPILLQHSARVQSRANEKDPLLLGKTEFDIDCDKMNTVGSW